MDVNFDRAFSYRNVTEIEVVDAIMKIGSDAVGLDSIPLSFIKLISKRN